MVRPNFLSTWKMSMFQSIINKYGDITVHSVNPEAIQSKETITCNFLFVFNFLLKLSRGN